MGKMFIDEKGPQETISISTKYDDNRKLNLGDDLMRSYVADMIYVQNSNVSILDSKFDVVKKEYQNNRKNKNEKELKGSTILKGNFKYGFASLKKENATFYSELIEMLLDIGAKNLLFAVNKMSIAVDARLTNWILTLEKKRLIPSATLFKYVITKYFEIEASEIVVNALFDQTCSNKKLSYIILEDLNQFITKNKGINRMEVQLNSYKELIKLIKKNKHLLTSEINNEVKFDWDKVSFALDLWITENIVNGDWSDEPNELILDEGIPVEPFDHLKLDHIIAGQDSKKHVGLQIADFIVVLAGSCITRLTTALRYDKSNPGKIILLDIQWLKFKDYQFKLVCLLAKFLLGSNLQYGIVCDTYFDETLSFEVFIRYIVSFENFDEYNKIDPNIHAKNILKMTISMANEKWESGIKDELGNRALFGSLESGIIHGVKRKL